MVAALAAVIVVRLTHRSTRKLTVAVEAREALLASMKVADEALGLHGRSSETDWDIENWIDPLIRMRLQFASSGALHMPSAVVAVGV
ncbi:hypothetical protein [Kribbella sp. NBC_00889]|uniref:hypothetical protein n=1 Tax=Kribbella sp. NBC_00889 TaxID=2975974 RepID=UPI003869325B|nr:hypothetical protein OG817_44900 [Kribbella sp. NBC_00889]